MINLELMYPKSLLSLRVIYFKVAVSQGKNKKLLHLDCFSIFLVEIFSKTSVKSPSLQHLVNICTKKP